MHFKSCILSIWWTICMRSYKVCSRSAKCAHTFSSTDRGRTEKKMRVAIRGITHQPVRKSDVCSAVLTKNQNFEWKLQVCVSMKTRSWIGYLMSWKAFSTAYLCEWKVRFVQIWVDFFKKGIRVGKNRPEWNWRYFWLTDNSQYINGNWKIEYPAITYTIIWYYCYELSNHSAEYQGQYDQSNIWSLAGSLVQPTGNENSCAARSWGD